MLRFQVDKKKLEAFIARIQLHCPDCTTLFRACVCVQTLVILYPSYNNNNSDNNNGTRYSTIFIKTVLLFLLYNMIM